MSRKMQSMVANPTYDRFKEIVSGQSLNNLSVKFKDVSNSYEFFDSNSNRLRRSSTRQKPKMAKEEYMKIPKEFYQLHNFFTLIADVMFVNGIPFRVTFSRNIILIT